VSLVAEGTGGMLIAHAGLFYYIFYECTKGSRERIAYGRNQLWGSNNPRAEPVIVE
jgi:hypothetical protein